MITYDSLKKSFLYSWNVLHCLHTISHLLLHICCIVHGIVHFINNYPHSVEFIVINFKKKNIISLHDLLFSQYTLTTCIQGFSFSHKIQFIYFHIYFLLEACAHDLRLASPESTTAQVLYSTSITDLLLFLIAEWSQFLVTIFIQTQLLYLYSFCM